MRGGRRLIKSRPMASSQKLPALQKVQLPPFKAYSNAIRFAPACANTAVNRSPVQESFAGPGRGISLLAAQSLAAEGTCGAEVIRFPPATR